MSNANVTVLTSVGLGDGSYYLFGYENPWGIANRISRYGPGGRALNYTFYNIPPTSTAQTDSPRFTEQRVWAVDWNGGAEAVTQYNVDPNGGWSQQVTPDATVYNEFYATSGWATGLPVQTEVRTADGTLKKWTTTAWTQDNPNLSYQQNPRPFETNIYDAEGNHRRTTISYTSYNLPFEVTEYAADATTPLRRTQTYYNLDSAYTNRRIIGLLDARYVYDGSWNLAAKTVYAYDRPEWGGFMQGTAQAPTQHDEASYNSNFILGRGNLVYVGRFDVTAPEDWAKVTATTVGYNETGQPAFTRDALGHQTSIFYGDNFWGGDNSRNTYAYPTAVLDADGNWSYTQYGYDFGAVTATQTPPPAGSNQGPTINYSYDPVGRPLQVTNATSGAYTRYEYDVAWGHTRAYSTIEAGQGESYTNTIVDGAGHVHLVVPSHAGSAGGYRVQRMDYDAMGRLMKQSNMTETDGGGTPTGDDAQAGYVWTEQSYDWKGRPTRTTNPDGTTREVTYGGCGCAGGAVTTVKDERGRRKRYTADVLGRLAQVEELNWDQSVYAYTNYYYNGRDQLVNSNQAGQWRGFGYDGYGRLSAQDTPEQGHTAYSYNADDTVQTVTDARGATQTVSYNGRQLITGITYGVPAGVAQTANVTYSYDAAGNRTQMTDGLGSVSYSYDQWSRLTAETRSFTGVGAYTLAYGYNLAGEVTSVTNPWGAQVGYTHDKDGRTTNVSGANYGGVTSYANNLQYRAFDGLKAMNYGNGRTLSVSYNNRQQVSSWQVPGVLGWQYSYTDYYGTDDGRVMFAQNTASSTTGGGRDAALDRSYDYDQVGRLTVSHTGYEARLHMNRQQANDPTGYGPYSQAYNYDVWGNMTQRQGWGGENASYTASFDAQNRRVGSAYDAAGNLTSDGGQGFSYDAAGRQTFASGGSLTQGYDGDGLRAKKVDGGATTYYLRSSVLGKQVVAELTDWGAGYGWSRGYVYVGGQLLAVQQSSAAHWVAQDPVTKSQRVMNSSGAVESTVDLDPWGGETSASINAAFEPRRYTSYERDSNRSDDAQARRYNRWWSRFDQPDPYDGSYDMAEPQSFNRYSYVHNDPVNFTDPTGLYEGCVHEAMTKFLATLTGRSDDVAAALGRFAGDGPGGADSSKYAATSLKNAIKGIFGKGPSAQIHFASKATLARGIANFNGYMALQSDQGYQQAAFVLHSIQDVHGAHQGYHLPLGHALAGHTPDRIIGDDKFLRAANESFQVLSGDNSASLSGQQVNDLINAIVAGCGNNANKLRITEIVPIVGGGGGDGVGGGGRISPISFGWYISPEIISVGENNAAAAALYCNSLLDRVHNSLIYEDAGGGSGSFRVLFTLHWSTIHEM